MAPRLPESTTEYDRYSLGDVVKVKGVRGHFKVMYFRTFEDRTEASVFGPVGTNDAKWRTFLVERLGAKKKEPRG